MVVSGTLEFPPLILLDYLCLYRFYQFTSLHKIWFEENIWWL